jgi:hypothetical protein
MSARLRSSIAAVVVMTILPGLDASAQQLPVIADAPAFRTENFLILPAAILSSGYDSNIHREGPPNGPIAATELFGVGTVRTFAVARPFLLNTESAAEYSTFKDKKGEGGLSWSNRASVAVGIAALRPKARVRASDTYARPTGFEIGERSRHQELDFGGGFEVLMGHRARAGAEVRHLSLNYDASAKYQDSSLYETLSLDLLGVGANFSYEVSPLTNISIVGSADQYRFRRAPQRDADSESVAFGLSVARPAAVSGSGQVGVRWFRSLTGTSNTFVGITGNGTITYSRPSGTLISGRVSRDTQHSYDPALAYYVFTTVGGSLFMRPGGWRLTVGGGHTWLDYRYAGTTAGLHRVDHHTFAEWSLGHRLGRAMELGLNGQREMKTGTAAFTGNRLMAYWALSLPYVNHFDRPIPGVMP